ncbi:hypothetical protein C1645_777705 [Glomus cerebriforme]|uniref:Uncharacterized protein n=1 Tax=Glomus cerebriforme TaxID=658196 RepID=A0A397SRK2_9GLOM|nr:hypothetical protein C1645_777705 [Glomus cerebriforme]
MEFKSFSSIFSYIFIFFVTTVKFKWLHFKFIYYHSLIIIKSFFLIICYKSYKII